MQSTRDLVAAVAFAAFGGSMLFSIEPVWWSVASPIVVFAGAVVFAVRGIRAMRANRLQAQPFRVEARE
jgi:hypothetical protein